MLAKKRFLLPIVIGTLSSISAAASFATQEPQKLYLGFGYSMMSTPDDEDAEPVTNKTQPYSGSLFVGYKFRENFAIEAHYLTTVINAKGDTSLSGLDLGEYYWGALASQTPGLSVQDAMMLFPSVTTDLSLQIEGTMDASMLYGVYRTSGTNYLKTKLGLAAIHTRLKTKMTSAQLNVTDYTGATQQTTLTANSPNFSDLQGAANTIEKENLIDLTASVGLGHQFSQHFSAEIEYVRLNEDFELGTVNIQYHF